MPYPTAILFTLALFTVGMVAIGWWQDPTAPALGDWLVAKVTEGGLWTGLLPFLAAAGFFAWREARMAEESTKEATERATKEPSRDG